MSALRAEPRRSVDHSRVAYVVSEYPALSHTFIQREVVALRALGVAVDVFSIHRAAPSVMSTIDAEELATTFAVLPVSLPTLIGAHVRALVRSPRAYAQTLRYAMRAAPRGGRAKLWQCFYFAEAIVVWNRCRVRGIRHLHAHFANVGSDVAWLASQFGRFSDGDGAWHWSFTMHGCTEFWDVERFNLSRKVSAAGLVIAISEFTRAQLMGFVDPEHWDKIDVIHCGVDLGRYPFHTREDRHGRPVEILCVGRLSAEKGQLLVLRALADLVRAGKPVRLTLVGDGPLRAKLQREARKLGITEYVTFTGAVDQDEIPAYYERADIYCQPSFMEGIPVVLMEAMATGLPVVSSGVAGIPELVADGRSGILVPPGQPGVLAAALGTLVDSPELRQTLGAAGRTTVEHGFDADQCAVEVAERFQDPVFPAGAVPPGG